MTFKRLLLICLIFQLSLLLNYGICSKDVIQYIRIDYDDFQPYILEFKAGTTILFSVSNYSTSDHNVLIKSVTPDHEVVKSPILNYNSGQKFFIYTFTQTGSYIIIDEYSSTNKMKMSLSINSSLTTDGYNPELSISDSKQNSTTNGVGKDIDFTRFFNDSLESKQDDEEEETGSKSTKPKQKKSINEFFLNYTSNKNTSKSTTFKKNYEEFNLDDSVGHGEDNNDSNNLNYNTFPYIQSYLIALLIYTVFILL